MHRRARERPRRSRRRSPPRRTPSARPSRSTGTPARAARRPGLASAHSTGCPSRRNSRPPGAEQAGDDAGPRAYGRQPAQRADAGEDQVVAARAQHLDRVVHLGLHEARVGARSPAASACAVATAAGRSRGRSCSRRAAPARPCRCRCGTAGAPRAARARRRAGAGRSVTTSREVRRVVAEPLQPVVLRRRVRRHPLLPVRQVDREVLRHLPSPRTLVGMSEVLDAARRARTAAATLAPLPRGVKDAALRAMADALLEHADGCSPPTPRTSPRPAPPGRREAQVDRLALTPARVEAMADGLRHVAGAARPGRRGGPGLHAAQRARAAAGPGAARRHRHRLRGPPQRHRRRRRPVRQERQRGAAAGERVGVPLQHGPRRRARGGGDRSRPARAQRPARPRHRPVLGPGADAGPRPRRPAHPARRRRADLARWSRARPCR